MYDLFDVSLRAPVLFLLNTFFRIDRVPEKYHVVFQSAVADCSQSRGQFSTSFAILCTKLRTNHFDTSSYVCVLWASIFSILAFRAGDLNRPLLS
jgi:hypothetical protein